ncbi:MerR family transcriptional regulator [Streptomyces clavifer]|uniref:MerR family transcriptional regulator n=1 Tax=Streptomyces clavifer TaxID=68188 RepID=UPI003413DFC9
MLSISDFSEMCDLPPQTLRYYHSEGLLVPAGVDERTGYRSYTFEQVEQAMLIAVLRGTGMSVKRVRSALDEPDAAPALLQQHTAELQRERRTQDEAISNARAFFTSAPEVRLQHVAEGTVVSKVVPGPPIRARGYDWEAVDAASTAAVHDLVRAVESRGGVVSGPPWRTLAAETSQQHSQVITHEGPHWLVKVPITADDEVLTNLPCDVEVQRFEARDELSIFIPGKNTTAKHATAISRLIMYPLDAAHIDMARMRHVLHDAGVETCAAIRKLDEGNGDG